MLQTLSNFVHQGWQTATSTFGNENKPKIDIDDLPEFTLSEVSEHWQSDDCWIVVFDRVYDVTDFVDEHPGGAFIMQEHFGRDATLVFRGSRHGPDAYDMLDKFLIGVLVEVSFHYNVFYYAVTNQQLFRRVNECTLAPTCGWKDNNVQWINDHQHQLPSTFHQMAIYSFPPTSTNHNNLFIFSSSIVVSMSSIQLILSKWCV